MKNKQRFVRVCEQERGKKDRKKLLGKKNPNQTREVVGKTGP